ncbi:Alpha-glucosidase, family 31 of glycosyl hydrolase, partial [human gut metagenome]
MRVGKILQNALKKSENYDKEGSALMIKKFTSGNPIDTQAVVEKFNALPIAEFPLGGKFENGNFVFEFDMADSDIVYGLGEAPRGINKRGWVYIPFFIYLNFSMDKFID